MKATILILKHAIFLQHSNESKTAISQVVQNYQAANIDSKIQQYLETFSPEDSVKQFAGFIMATDITLLQSSIDTGKSETSLLSN
ncbi:hypothetical protein EI94DRAFT_758697 [Lactarius quietus]|nr:hypothetical protein EI94DRAFT_758697 [Lactarius quietus]